MSKKHQKKIVNKLKYAVLICQTFANDFSTSSCFMYVDNFPLITYSLNWISQSGIQQIFVFYSKQKEQVENYFTKYEKSIDLKINMEYVKVGELKNFGDVMRQTQFRNLISQDFLVLYADTLTNIDLSKMIESHFAKKQQLKNVVLTTGMQQGIAKNIHILNSNTNQILQVQLNTSQDFVLNSDKINLKKVNIDIRRDICPIDIFICTVDVLKSFKETFEYTNMNDFIVGMITSEVYEEKINAYIIQKEQRSFRANRGINFYLLYMNYICRYLNPYCIQNQQDLQPKQKQLKYNISQFSIQQFNKIIKTKSQVKENSRISHNVFIGQNSIISQNSVIKKSIILKNCKIGSGVSLDNCIILDGCQIPNNSVYSHSLIENVGSTLKIVSFKNQFNYEPYQILIDQPLYEQTPQETTQNNFEDDLLELIKDEPEGQALTDLFTLRKLYNKPLNEFTKQMIRLSAPSGVKGVQKFVESWGQILVKFHEDQSLLLSSLFFACKNIQNYQKAFHIFLQFLYRDEILSSQKIKKWFEGKDLTDKTLAMSTKFVAGLDEEQQEDQENDQQ